MASTSNNSESSSPWNINKINRKRKQRKQQASRAAKQRRLNENNNNSNDNSNDSIMNDNINDNEFTNNFLDMNFNINKNYDLKSNFNVLNKNTISFQAEQDCFESGMSNCDNELLNIGKNNIKYIFINNIYLYLHLYISIIAHI